MTFKDLKKRVTLQTAQAKALERLNDKLFWIWDIEEHKLANIRTNGNCCFNHIIGYLSYKEWKKQCLIMK
jgi:hypothetical protein